MPPIVARPALALATALGLSAWGAEAPRAEPAAPMGHFEALGARLGMDMEVALRAIASAKPQWAAGLDASTAHRDCALEGRGIANLEFAGGLVSARMDARCLPDGRGHGSLLGLAIATRLAPGLLASDVKEALVSRYGAPSSDNPLPGGGFEIAWTAPEPSGPAQPHGESLTATLTARAPGSAPLALELRLVRPPKPAAPADSDRARALGRLPL